MRKGGVAEHRAQPRRPDPTRPEMLVAVRPRRQVGFRVVEMHHHETIQADEAVERLDHAADDLRTGDLVARSPQMSRIEAERHPGCVGSSRLDRFADVRELLDRRPYAESSARGVLDHQPGRIRGRVDFAQHELHAFRDSLRASLDARSHMRTGVDVHEARPVLVARDHLLAEDGDRPLEEVLLRAGQVHQVRSVNRKRSDIEVDQAPAELGKPSRRDTSTPPCSRVIGEDLQRGSADLVRSFDCLHHAPAERQVRTEPSAVGEHARMLAHGAVI